MSTTEENKAAFRRTFEELLNQGNYAIVDELLVALADKWNEMTSAPLVF